MSVYLSVRLSVSLSSYLSDILLTFWATFVLITKLIGLTKTYQSSYRYHLPKQPCLPCHPVSPSSITMVSRNVRLTTEWKTYQSFHSYQLPVTPFPPSPLCDLIITISLWLQGIKDLSKFPQLPVTSYTLSFLYLATMYPNHLLLSGFK